MEAHGTFKAHATAVFSIRQREIHQDGVEPKKTAALPGTV